MTGYAFEERTEWRTWVTPRPIEAEPVHRWYVFPHSFASELVHELIREWELGANACILDPFVGAGTTLLAAKEIGIPAHGYDLSPLAVLVSRAKVANYSLGRLENAWRVLHKRLRSHARKDSTKQYPELVQKALPGKLLDQFDAISRGIFAIDMSEAERNFFRLALVSIIPEYSRAVATGGWLKWVNRQKDGPRPLQRLSERVETMLQDLRETKLPRRSLWTATQADARKLPDRRETYSAVITSPPYPNRHDYTRVFGVELMFAFLDWEETRNLRYQSFHSHPEARPIRPKADGYVQPQQLTEALDRIRQQTRERRLAPMLEGYFLDMYLCLREVRRICRPRANIAFVVGNVQYCGTPVLVDELTAEIGEQAGLACQKLLVARYRGNSAQQMGRYGRRPSREAVVLFRRP